MVQHLEPCLAQACYRRVVLAGGEVHRVVDVDAAPTSAEPELRAPEPDPRPVRRHDPDRSAAGRPPLDDRKTEDA